MSYSIDRVTIPSSLGWDDSINSAAQTWNNVTPSHFQFAYSPESANIISYEQLIDPNALGATEANPLFGFQRITEKWTKLNSDYTWDTNNTPIPGNLDSNGSSTTVNVQNVMTHELGHWLFLYDIYDGNCAYVTMYSSGDYGEIGKITLEVPDKNGINWQYP